MSAVKWTQFTRTGSIAGLWVLRLCWIAETCNRQPKTWQEKTELNLRFPTKVLVWCTGDVVQLCISGVAKSEWENMFLLKCQFGVKAFYEEVERSSRGPENVSMQIFGLTMTVIFYYHNGMLLHAISFLGTNLDSVLDYFSLSCHCSLWGKVTNNLQTQKKTLNNSCSWMRVQTVWTQSTFIEAAMWPLSQVQSAISLEGPSWMLLNILPTINTFTECFVFYFSQGEVER